MAISLSGFSTLDVEEFGVSGPFARPKLNFVQGGATSVAVADDVGNNKVTVTISSTDTTGMAQLSSGGQRFSFAGGSGIATSVNPSNFSTMFCWSSTSESGTIRTWAAGSHACFSQGCAFNASNFMTATMFAGTGGVNTGSGLIMTGSGNSVGLTPTNNGSGGVWNITASAPAGTHTGATAHVTFGWSA